MLVKFKITGVDVRFSTGVVVVALTRTDVGVGGIDVDDANTVELTAKIDVTFVDETTTMEVVEMAVGIEVKFDDTENTVDVANTEVELKTIDEVKFTGAKSLDDVGTTEVELNWTKGVEVAKKLDVELRKGAELAKETADVGEKTAVEFDAANIDDVTLTSTGGVDVEATNDDETIGVAVTEVTTKNDDDETFAIDVSDVALKTVAKETLGVDENGMNVDEISDVAVGTTLVVSDVKIFTDDVTF